MENQEFKKEITHYKFAEFDKDDIKKTRKRMRNMVEFLSISDPGLLAEWIAGYETTGKMIFKPIFSMRIQIKFLIWRKLNEYPEKFANAYFSTHCNENMYQLICDGGSVIDDYCYQSLEEEKYEPKTIGQYLYEMADIDFRDTDGIYILQNGKSQIGRERVTLEFVAKFKDDSGNEDEQIKTFQSSNKDIIKDWRQMTGILKRRAEFLMKEDEQRQINKNNIVLIKSASSWDEKNKYNKIIIFLTLIQLFFPTPN